MRAARRVAAVDVELEVAFHDVDSLRVVWHGHYLKFVEIGRTALMRSRGLDVAQLEALGHRSVVIETHCRHTFPLRYGERFRVSSWLEEIEHRVRVGFEIHNLTRDRRSAIGHTILASLDADGALLLATPEDLLALLR